MKWVSHIILATLLSTGTAVAQETIDFDRHDTNSDGFLTDQEWSDIDAVVIAFDDVDADGDGKVSKAEVTAAADVEAKSTSQAGADLSTQEVTADDHSMAQSGQIDRNAKEEDPTMRDAASEDSSTSSASSTASEDRSMTTDASASDSEQSGFVTADERSQQQASGASDEQSATPELQGGLATQPSDVAAEDQEDASVEQPDVEMQNVDTAAARDADTMSASTSSDKQKSQSKQDSGSSQQQAAQTGSSQSKGGTSQGSQSQSASSQQQGSMQQAGKQGGSSQQGKQAFRDADKDGDQRLSQSEVKEAGFDYVVMYFEPLDVNRDSYLDEYEWDQSNANRAAPGIRDQEDASLYLNGDGPQDTRFERSEYEGDEGAVRFEEDFDTYDINDDGYLDESEAVETDWVDVNLFEYSDANDDGLIDIGEANDGFMEWGDDEEEEVVTGEDY